MCNYFGFKLNDIFFYPMDFCGNTFVKRTGEFMKLIKIQLEVLELVPKDLKYGTKDTINKHSW